MATAVFRERPGEEEDGQLRTPRSALRICFILFILLWVWSSEFVLATSYLSVFVLSERFLFVNARVRLVVQPAIRTCVQQCLMPYSSAKRNERAQSVKRVQIN